MKSAMQQKWEGRWNQLKGRVKKAWSDITDDDLKDLEGDVDKLVGVIQERTGETREAIEKRLEEDEKMASATR